VIFYHDYTVLEATFLSFFGKNISMDLECLANVLKKHREILFAYLYGSVARGHARKDSDIDVGIFLKRDFARDVFYEFKVAAEIERKCNLKNVEVVVLNNKPLRFLNQVLRYGRLMFCRDEKARIEFETYVTKAYIDFLPYYREYDRMRLRT